MGESQRIGLYYPYLHFSDNWLKIAALYWPRMGRITPPGLHLSDSNIVRALSDELNFTVNVAPGSAGEELTSALVYALETHSSEFRNRYAISAAPLMRSDWCGPSGPPTGDWRVRNLGELNAAAEVVALHAGKAEDSLWEMLSEAGLAVQSGDWWGLHPELAWLYMCALTDKLARQNLLIPTTDQVIAHVESLSWTDDLFISTLLEHDPAKIAVPRTGQRERIALLALNLVIPRNLEEVPVQKIIRIRQNYAADFDAFYDEIADLANSVGNELSDIADQEVLAAYIDHEAKRRFQQPLINLQREMRGQGVDATVTALTTKFELPTSAAIVAGGFLTHHPIIAAGGALALGIASTLRSFQRDRYQVAPSAASYLWRIEQTITPDGLMRSLLHQMY